MLASLGRPGSDFDEVVSALAESGYHAMLPEQPARIADIIRDYLDA